MPLNQIKTTALRLAVAAAGVALTTSAVAVPSSAAPPEQFEDLYLEAWPDFESNLVFFMNSSRAAWCTAEQIAFEEAIYEWEKEGDFEAPFPEPPEAEPPAYASIQIKLKILGEESGWVKESGDNLPVDVWVLDDPGDQTGTGPCTDTDDADTQFATGTGRHKWSGRWHGQNFVGNQRTWADLVGVQDDRTYRYTRQWHVNESCAGGEESPPKCLIEKSTLTEL